MVREEIAFVRQSLGIPEPEPETPPETALSAPAVRTVSWKDLQRSIDSFLGVPYLWGGETRQGTDCSGFTQTVYGEQGVRIPRLSRDQYGYLKNIGSLVGGPRRQEALERGDLVFFNKNGRGRITHVGVYMGIGKFAHASCSRGVVISSLEKRYYKRLFVDGGGVCALAK
jgi:cell wall-associated NlpC family hydrolase